MHVRRSANDPPYMLLDAVSAETTRHDSIARTSLGICDPWKAMEKDLSKNKTASHPATNLGTCHGATVGSIHVLDLNDGERSS